MSCRLSRNALSALPNKSLETAMSMSGNARLRGAGPLRRPRAPRLSAGSRSASLEFPRLLVEPLQLRLDRSRTGKQHLTALRRNDATLGTLKQRLAKLHFHSPELLGQRRLRLAEL